MIINHKFNSRNQIEADHLKMIEIGFEILSKKLNLPNLTLQAQRQAGWAGSNAYHAGSYNNNEKLIKINFRNLQGASGWQILEVLGHEFRHAVQYNSGLIVRNSVWLGGIQYSTSTHNSSRLNEIYRNYPWEIDARNFQKQYAQLIIDAPEFKEFLNNLDLTMGSPLMKPDRLASLKLLPVNDVDRVQIFFSKKDNQHYWMDYQQLGLKKWSKKGFQLAWTSNILRKQKFIEVFVPVDIDDLVS